MSGQYILKWRHGKRPEITWFLRGLSDDGSFYGEVTVVKASSRRQTTVEGTLPPSHVERLRQLLQKINDNPPGNAAAGWVGLLAKGPLSHPEILIRYVSGDEASLPQAQIFLDMVEMLSPFIDAQTKSHNPIETSITKSPFRKMHVTKHKSRKSRTAKNIPDAHTVTSR